MNKLWIVIYKPVGLLQPLTPLLDALSSLPFSDPIFCLRLLLTPSLPYR